MPLLLAAVLLAIACVPRTAGDRRNVVVVLADDLNDWAGALTPHPTARPPNIERLASQAVLFRQAYAASPKCNPSRTALLLGVRPYTSGTYDDGGSYPLYHSYTGTMTNGLAIHCRATGTITLRGVPPDMTQAA